MLFFSRDLSVDEKNVYMEALAFILNVGKSNNDANKEYMETQMAEIGLSKKDFRSAKKVKTAGELAKDIKGIGDIKVKRFILREMILLALALAGGGVALYYFKFRKPKADTTGPDDLDEYDFGEDEDDEDEPTPEDEEPAQDKEE